MKIRPKGFLSQENINHASEEFDYIKELHEYLWKFIRAVLPGASGRLEDYADKAIRELIYTEKVKSILYSFHGNAISCEEACEQLTKLSESRRK